MRRQGPGEAHDFRRSQRRIRPDGCWRERRHPLGVPCFGTVSWKPSEASVAAGTTGSGRPDQHPAVGQQSGDAHARRFRTSAVAGLPLNAIPADENLTPVGANPLAVASKQTCSTAGGLPSTRSVTG
jgi:hypothetical protein